MMMTTSLPALESCLNDECKANGAGKENYDRLSELSEDILLSIVSSFTMKEVARLSLVSRRWEYIWHCFPHLIFEDPRAMDNIRRNWKAIVVERPDFVRMVDRVVEEHLGTAIDELRITFDLDKKWQSYVDKWAAFALDKQVKRLEFNFTSPWRYGRIRYGNGIVLPMCDEPLDLPPKFTGFKSFLTSLCLKYVNVTDEFMDYVSHSCPSLENLCIVGSKYLTRMSGAFDQVKHLEVTLCRNMKTIDISARTLRSFTMYSQHIQPRMAHASSLVEVSIGGYDDFYAVTYAIDSLALYLSQLLYLNLRISKKMILGIDHSAAMPKLQHLELQVVAYGNQSLRGWIPLILACPLLQKLTLKLNRITKKFDQPVYKWPGLPLKCLKTLEIVGYVGQTIDLGLAFFVLENASMLEEVIVTFVPRNYKTYDIDARERLVKLQDKIPQGVKLTTVN
ncbi:putative F-box/FBD/LRR-repeat protein At5g56810 isoform X1 [Silene latifolia]|uniref:putative F-box/FBD/LRR-repeat protein At5g56810 isoform X1 n=1 Tax=Silene latifolia TaxID=37657 RepID=UPI003D77BDB4